MARRSLPLESPTDAVDRLRVQLRQHRHVADLSLTELAEKVGCSRGHLSRIENGESTPGEALVLDLDIVLESDGLLVSLFEEVLGDRRQRAYIAAQQKRHPEGLPLVREARDGHADRDAVPETSVSLPLHGDRSEWVQDETAVEGRLVTRGEVFTKAWRIRNAGTVPWRSRLVQRVGPAAAASMIRSAPRTQIADTEPGEEVVVEVACRAPLVEGSSAAHWKMIFADGRLCWPDRYSHGLNMLIITVSTPPAACASCDALPH